MLFLPLRLLRSSHVLLRCKFARLFKNVAWQCAQVQTRKRVQDSHSQRILELGNNVNYLNRLGFSVLYFL